MHIFYDMLSSCAHRHKEKIDETLQGIYLPSVICSVPLNVIHGEQDAP